jgi:hypothetical protein
MARSSIRASKPTGRIKPSWYLVTAEGGPAQHIRTGRSPAIYVPQPTAAALIHAAAAVSH